MEITLFGLHFSTLADACSHYRVGAGFVSSLAQKHKCSSEEILPCVVSFKNFIKFPTSVYCIKFPLIIYNGEYFYDKKSFLQKIGITDSELKNLSAGVRSNEKGIFGKLKAILQAHKGESRIRKIKYNPYTPNCLDVKVAWAEHIKRMGIDISR